MKMKTMVRNAGVGAFALAVIAACGGANKSFNDTCSSTSDCQSGYVCPTVGPMAGKCTKSCTKDQECAAIGAGVCTSDVCLPK